MLSRSFIRTLSRTSAVQPTLVRPAQCRMFSMKRYFFNDSDYEPSIEEVRAIANNNIFVTPLALDDYASLERRSVD